MTSEVTPISESPLDGAGPVGVDYLWGWRCNGKGCCCKGWRIGLSEPDVTRLALVSRGSPLEDRIHDAIRVKKAAPFARLILPPTNRPGGGHREVGELARGANGQCTMLAEDLLCDVHRTLGEHALPNICQSFPVTVRASEYGATTAWEALCPEVANALAAHTGAARITPQPTDFNRQLFAEPEPTPHASRLVIRHRRAGPAEVRAFRLAAARLLADAEPRLLDALGTVLAAIVTWEQTGAPPDLARAFTTESPRGAALLAPFARRISALGADRAALKRSLAFVRPFFEHHVIGTGPTVDAIEALLKDASPEALSHTLAAGFGAAGPETTRTLGNWLAARFARHIPGRISVSDDAARTSAILADSLFFLGLMRHGAAAPPALVAAAVALGEAWHRSVDRQTGAFARAIAIRLAQGGQAPPTRELHELAGTLAATASQTSITERWRKSLLARIAALALERSLAVRDALPRDRAPAPAPTSDGSLAAFARADLDAARFHASVARRPADGAEPMAAALFALAVDLGLDPAELALVGTLVAVATDEGTLRAIAHVTLDYGGPGLSAEALRALFPGIEPQRLTRTLGRLIRLGLVRWIPQREQRTHELGPGIRVVDGTPVHVGAGQSIGGLTESEGIAPVFQDDDRLSLHTDALAIMLGRPAANDTLLPASLVERARWHDAIAPADLLAPSVVAALTRIGPTHHGIIALTGAAGHCRRGLVEDALRAAPSSARGPWRGPLTTVSVDALVPATTRDAPRRPGAQVLRAIQQGIAAAARHAAIRAGHLLILWPPIGTGNDGLAGHLGALVAAISRDLGRPVFIATPELPRSLLGATALVEVPVPPITMRDRARLIARLCPPDVLLPDGPALAELIRATPAEPRVLYGALFAALATAEADPTGPTQRTLSVTSLARALRVALARRIGDFAQLVPVTHTLADLQLPPLQLGQMHEIITSVQHRRLVMDTWGFATPDRRGQGVTTLFHGPPGTGKSMAAGVLAAELSLEVFRIDLSRVVDKYVGETEKALAKVFDEAERGDVLLLFDEADSLFGKRSEASSAVDRHANLGVNYLLQRIEAYRGLVVLTTNHEAHMDPAFKRRIRFQVLFPMPDADERARIWRHLVPPECPVSRDVDFEELGYLFELSGGHIRSAVLNAAVAALRDDTAVSMRHLVAAGKHEYRALGRVVRDLD